MEVLKAPEMELKRWFTQNMSDWWHNKFQISGVALICFVTTILNAFLWQRIIGGVVTIVFAYQAFRLFQKNDE